MARTKKSGGKKKKADGVKRAPTLKPRALNPFEVHVNRQKFEVMGRKLKNDKGLPGVSRAKALKKRKATLLQEYRVHNKVNEFHDRRIGENNKGMTAEDRIVARFTAERNRSRKKTKFNLADDEVLTHRGQSLNEIEKFDNPKSDSEDEAEGENGRLQANFVRDAHFGGFMSKKEETEGSTQTRQNLIHDLIAESKKRKAEKQKESEKTAELTNKLDEDWKDLQSVVYNSKTKKQKNEVSNPDEPKPKMEDYDKAVRQLVYESRGVPSNRLKSEDEVAMEEKLRLEKLESERLARMHGKYDGLKPVPKHRSADDLDDGFQIEEDEPMLSYDTDGNVNGGEFRVETKDDSEDDDDDDEVEEQKVKSKVDHEDSDDEDECEDEEEAEAEDQGEDSDDNDSLNDLRMRDSDHEGEESEHEEETEDTAQSKPVKKVKVAAVPDFKQLKDMMEQARKELPFTFAVPETYGDFVEVFEEKQLAQQSVILERMLKCNHPSLGSNNTSKLGALYAFLLQWINDNTVDPPENKFVSNPNEDFMNTILPHIFEIVQLSGAGNARRCTAAVLSEKYDEWRKSKTQRVPPLDTVVFFQLILHIFPTSDFRHPVTSPAAVFMAEVLGCSKVGSLRDICNGLFICELVTQYTSLSHRFLPEAFYFLSDIICAFAQNESNSRFCDNLSPSNMKRDQVLATALKILRDMAEQSKPNVPSLPVMLKSAVNSFEDISEHTMKKLGKAAITCISELKNICENPERLEVMMKEKKRPKPLKMFEPRIEAVIFDGKRRVNMSEKKREKMKLVHKYKKEMKGAVREIRRDRDFLAKVQLKETMKSDSVRKAKVKDILGSLSNQAGEINKWDRSRKNKKK